MIGTGNVANVLCRLLAEHQHQVVQVIGRDIERGAMLAEITGAKVSQLGEPILPEAELCIIAVADSALEVVLPLVPAFTCPVAHTAGSQSINILRHYAQEYGILYPLQTLRKEMVELPPIPFLIDGNNVKTIKLLCSLAKTISDNVELADDEKRGRLHVAAVVTCNFTNHLYNLAEQYCIKEQLNFDLLRPLILQTAQRVMHHSPANVQTGPAVRKDMITIEKHLDWLQQHPELKEIYLRLSNSIMDHHL